MTRKTKAPACTYFEGKVECFAWLTVKGLGAGANHTASKEEVTCGKLNDISFLRLVQSMGYLGKIGTVGLIKRELSGITARWKILYLQ